MLITILTLIGGLVLLVVGGELLVRGSVRVAERLGVSPLLIGLTLVGFGTSTPELVTSVEASLIGSPGIAIGNVVGSNIANILLILGASAVIFPLAVSSSALLRDGSFVILTALVFTLVGYTVGLTRPVGLVFVAALIGYMVYAYRQEKSTTLVEAQGHTAAFDRGEAFEGVEPAFGSREVDSSGGLLSWALPILGAVGGLAIIIFGGRLLVDAAIDLARTIGMTETVIGLTIVAVGTSAPELITSIVAALRKQSDIAVGNILGSNIYNILGIGGVTALIAPTSFPPEIVRFDNWVMIGASALLFAFAWNRNISRVEGGIMIATWVAYIAWLISQA
jgi:cation:H+ antiporter